MGDGDVEVTCDAFEVDATADATLICENADISANENVIISGSSITLEGTEVLVSDGSDTYDLVQLVGTRRALKQESDSHAQEIANLKKRIEQLELLLVEALGQISK